jgi:hypothetical protein
MLRLHIWMAGLFLMASCASRIPPSGGPKDTMPPEVTSSFPESGSLGFTGDLISLDVSEFVQLKDAGSGILISPPLKTPPLVSLKGKSVQIRFREKLAENTTYTIIIGPSVVDLTEGNALKEYSLVFSTGSVLDSLKLEGSVQDAFSKKPVKNALVMLYPLMNDSLPAKTLPIKLGRTDEAGNYLINHIREGSYMAFALQDGNSNFLYDLPEEKTGFTDTLIRIAPGQSAKANFRLSVNPEQRQRLMKQTFTQPGRITLNYARPVDSWKLSLPDGTTDPLWTSSFVPESDSLVAWLPRPASDTIRLISETTADELIRYDTLIIRIRTALTISARKGSGGAADTSLKFGNNLKGGKLIPDDTLRITSSRPIRSVDPSKMILLRENDTLAFQFPGKPIISRMGYSIAGFSSGGKKLKLLLLPGAFQDVYGVKNDTIRLEFKDFEEDDLGTLRFNINGKLPPGNWYWELINKQGDLILGAPYVDEEPLFVPNLIPGLFSVRLIRDQNSNRKWDHGNFYRKIQPEEILHYPSEINVRAGWDLEQTWELGD